MAIMGFGGGAMIASPLSVVLMNQFEGPGRLGVWQTFVTLGAICFAFMMFGAFTVRVPAPGWQPAAGRRRRSSRGSPRTTWK